MRGTVRQADCPQASSLQRSRRQGKAKRSSALRSCQGEELAGGVDDVCGPGDVPLVPAAHLDALPQHPHLGGAHQDVLWQADKRGARAADGLGVPERVGEHLLAARGETSQQRDG